jgi:uncharacterized protein YqhQ
MAAPSVPAPKFDVGGQAVIEGVMMRSPRSFTVVCRRPDGSIAIKEQEWRPLWQGLRVVRLPFLRGAIVLLESLWNGIAALTFSADQQIVGEQAPAGPPPRSLGAAAAPSGGSSATTYGMVAISVVFGLALFVGVPHLAAWGVGEVFGFDTSSFAFHAVDGVIKLALLVGYMAAISLMDDVRRVFQYHGAEHKAIFTYEKGLPLTVANARQQPRFHPRCGTSFLLIVIGVSVVVFSALLTFPIVSHSGLDHLAKILIKIPLMFPIAGVAYELIKLAGKKCDTSVWARAMSAPGMWLQTITTREPDDAQLEIALLSIRKTLWREAQGDAASPIEGRVEVYARADQIDLPIAA